MEVLENLRFKNLSRLVIKNYKTGVLRNICNRVYNGFIFCKEGELLFTVKGEEYLCDSSHVVLAPKGINYSVEARKDTTTFIIDFELDEGNFSDMYIFPIGDSEKFYLDYLNMQKRTFGVKSYKLANLSTLYDIASYIDNFGYNEKKFKIIKASEKYLEDNLYNAQISVKDIADKSNISEVYFRRMFKEKYGISPVQYITMNRIKKAKNLLVEDDFSISEISRVCGFLNIYSFSRVFKKRVGVSPSQYKKDIQF